MHNSPSQLHKKLQLRRRKPTVAPQDSIAAKVVLKKPFSRQAGHEDSELTPAQHINPTPTNNTTTHTLHHTYQHKQVQERAPGVGFGDEQSPNLPSLSLPHPNKQTTNN